MKKLLILLAVASFSLSSMAQEDETPTLDYSVATNSFWSNWFIQGNVGYLANYSNEEKSLGYSKSPFKSFRGSLGLSVAIGKWFTPGIGTRIKVSGIWGKSVIGTDADKNKIKQWNGQIQTLFNLSNLLYGYSESRVWNFIPYVGGGYMRNCSYDTNNIGLSAGLLNTWKLSDRIRLNFDLGYNIVGDDFEGMEYAWGRNADAAHDRWFTAEVGVTVALGKTLGWNKVPDVDAIRQLSQSQLDALNAQLGDANSEIDRLKNMLANQPEPQETVITQSVKEFITTPISVFFNLNKTEIAVLKDLVNVRALAKYAIENNSNILVTGYADSATGTPAHNQWLSEKRAKRVADELVNMGVKAEKIKTAAYGGVEILTPVDFNRRATVQITED